jgi:hypothetical protein
MKGTFDLHSSPSVVIAMSKLYLRGTRSEVTAKIMWK